MAKYRKKLIEVALPLAAINKASAREKSIRHGHPSTLHLWWARRPLAACRAVLFAQLVDDPSSDPCFRVGDTVDEQAVTKKREELFNLIEELVKWENSNNPKVINAAQAEIARSVASRKIELGELKKETIIFGRDEGKEHPDGPVSNQGVTAYEMVLMRCIPEVVKHFLYEYAPPILDPFAGGGSIPLEAQRLGLKAYASDLNPIPVLINKALIEIPSKFAGLPPINPEYQARPEAEKALDQWENANGLAEDVRYYGQWMRDKAEERIGHLYPKVEVSQEMVDEGRKDLAPYVGQELTVIAWLWARTVTSPNPSIRGKLVPLVSSFWLSKKKGKEAYVEPVFEGEEYYFSVKVGKPSDPARVNQGCKSTGSQRSFACLLSGTPMSFEYLRTEGQAGRIGKKLMAIVAQGNSGRVFLAPTEKHMTVPLEAKPEWKPEGNVPARLTGGTCVPYGLSQWHDLFTPRQLVALTTFSDLVKEVGKKVLDDAKLVCTLPDNGLPLHLGTQAYADAVVTYLAFIVDQLANHQSSLCSWNSPNTQMRCTFARQALPMVWDFAESNVFCKSSGSFRNLFERMLKAFKTLGMGLPGVSLQQDAVTAYSYKDQIIACDPPYYNNISYSDLSDFFYVWLRRALKHIYPDLLSTMQTPKSEELIASPYRHNGDRKKAAKFFEKGLGKAIQYWCRQGHPEYPTTIFYAFKQAESDTSGRASTGWETFLSGVIDAGYKISGTWPIRTEKQGRSVAIGTNALASSVVLVCIPRSINASLATRREFIKALRDELPIALRNLQCRSIAPVDLAQAAIGPGMSIFSRSAKVVEADGEPMTIRTALALINQVLDEVLAEQEGEFDADTRWAMAWFEQFGMGKGDYGVAETLSKAKNTSLEGLAEAGIVTSRAGSVKLLSRNELLTEWDPITDNRLSEWEATQYLIRILDQQGEKAAAFLLRKLGGDYGERGRDLAYRLYNICERKGWATEALAYNSLVLAWPEITKLVQTIPESPTQMTMF